MGPNQVLGDQNRPSLSKPDLRALAGGATLFQNYPSYALTASMKGLECSKLSKNIMNGKSYLFYIEAIPNLVLVDVGPTMRASR